MFTTGNLDNLDHDPTSTSALTAFHGTALSMTQQITDETPGTERHLDRASPNEKSKSKLVKPLMESYTQVPTAIFATDKPSPRRTVGVAIPQTAKLESDEAQTAWPCLGQALIANSTLPSPSEWGWQKEDNDGQWTPLWTILPEASKGCRELIKCGCKKQCCGRCQCRKANLKCTQLCFCEGQCTDL